MTLAVIIVVVVIAVAAATAAAARVVALVQDGRLNDALVGERVIFALLTLITFRETTFVGKVS
jgi:hypothetical protein